MKIVKINIEIKEDIMSMNAQDLCTIQECMIGYRKLIEWLPVIDEAEVDLKAQRIDIINHIMNLCGKELTRLSEAYRDE